MPEHSEVAHDGRLRFLEADLPLGVCLLDVLQPSLHLLRGGLPQLPVGRPVPKSDKLNPAPYRPYAGLSVQLQLQVGCEEFFDPA